MSRGSPYAERGSTAADRSAAPPAIVVRALSKVYRVPSLRPWQASRKVPALEGASFACPRGSTTCLLGPNGAGKTTVIKILAGLVAPDAGEATILNKPLSVDPASTQRVLGVATPNERSFYWRLTGRQNLDFFAALYGLRGRSRRERVAGVLAEVGLEAEADKPFRLYSTGLKQRLLLARALLHRPQVLLLDEPTAHLDPLARASIHELVREHLVGRLGVTVLYCTHDLAEAAELADHLVLLKTGRVVAEGSIEALRKMVAPGGRFIMELARPPAAGWTEGQSVTLVNRPNGKLLLILEDPGLIPRLIQACIAHGGEILSCSQDRESLPELFARIAGGEAR